MHISTHGHISTPHTAAKEAIHPGDSLDLAPFPHCSFTACKRVAAPYQEMAAVPQIQEDQTFEFLNNITDGFSEGRLLGKGAFGKVYKGVLDSMEVIAVKRLEENAPGLRNVKAYKELVQKIMAHRHENVVKMIAYCREPQKKLVETNGKHKHVHVFETLLCYEYLPKGSLHENLFATGTPASTMDWNTRFKIILGICHGLFFLHNLPDPIIHLDLKTQNILLDDKMVPKIADFGLSRLFGKEKSRMNTGNLVGSRGFMAPEYLYSGEMSAQSDIYSLGVMLIEITTGKEISLDIDNRLATAFIAEVEKVWTAQHIASKYSSLESPRLKEVQKCICIALKCVDINQRRRPSINEIVDELEGRSASS